MAGRPVLAIVAFSSLAFAFSNTHPLVAWSSVSSSVLDSFSNTDTSSPLLESILSQNEVCDYDAVIVINQPGLHASDLRNLSPYSHVSRSLNLSPSSRQFPYVPQQNLHPSLISGRVASLCQSRRLEYLAGQGGVTLEHGKKHVVCLNMPNMIESGIDRKTAMAQHDSTIEIELSALASTYPNHLIIYTGTPLPLRSRRQSPYDDEDDLGLPDFEPVFPSSQTSANTTLPQGGILKRYQLLTPGLITSLLVVFFILLPVLWVGISALASIQSPLRIESPKGFNAQERKNQ